MPISSKPTPIGLTLPIRNGANGGYFEQSTDSLTAYKANIVNLLQTIPGERRMNPLFGCRLWNVVFEPNDDFIFDKVNKIIKEDITRWIPGVSVSAVEVKYLEDDKSVDLRDMYKLYIVVQYVIDIINQSDTVKLTLNTNRT